MGLDNIRRRMAGYQAKADAGGTTEVTLCLAPLLLDELEAAESALAVEQRLEAEPQGKPRLGKPAKSTDLADAERAVEEARAAVREATVRLVFGTVSSTMYSTIMGSLVADLERAAEAAEAEFRNKLMTACLREAYEFTPDGEEPIRVAKIGADGRPVDDGYTWDEVHPLLRYGQWDLAGIQVLSLNRRVTPIPFSVTQSPRSPTSDETSSTPSEPASPPAAGQAGSRKRSRATTTTKTAG